MSIQKQELGISEFFRFQERDSDLKMFSILYIDDAELGRKSLETENIIKKRKYVL